MRDVNMKEVAGHKTVLEMSNLTKVFRVGFLGRKVTAVTDLNLDIRNNEIFGFLGPNGAGKTTTIKMILRLIHPTRGEIKILGRPNSDVKIRSKIGFMPENPYFYDYLTAGEFLRFYGQLMNISHRDRDQKAKELLNLVGLKDAENTQLRKFSKGMIQRVGIAQALLNDPELVILDEPMSGLDPVGRKEIRDIILDMKSKGKTVFFSTHILPDVEMICDRVGIIRNGHLSAVGTLSEILGPSVKGVEITARDIKDESALKGVTGRIVRQGNLINMVLENPEMLDDLLRSVLGQGGHVVEVFPHRQSLEAYFLEAIGENEKGPEVK